MDVYNPSDKEEQLANEEADVVIRQPSIMNSDIDRDDRISKPFYILSNTQWSIMTSYRETLIYS